ncbi:MAG: galactose mutarotase [Bacteroidales bacterium]|nr:galactose mutarotase [Bacteroides sp.]MCM1199484.1 galactose mutarotase [Clostridium sp.]MCM1502412.1 galactose mutarotase [Bacteroidales bacterium]
MNNYLKMAAFGAAAVLMASCAGKREVELIPAENFEAEVDGSQIALYTLKAGDITMQVTNFGARVVSLWTPDREGNYDDIVLGYNDIDTYINNPGERFLGAVVGPYANRIAGGTMEIDGEIYTMPQNNNGQTLHGGLKGLDMVVWDVIACDDSTIVFNYVHPDGQDGYPGNIDIMMTYELTSDNEFKVSYMAGTDKPTFVNISHHSFFNLKGEGKGDVLDNVMVINASHTTPVDSFLIPSGEIADVTGTPFDFREPHTIGERIGAENEQLANGGGYDHNWVLDRKSDSGLEFAASVYEPAGGRFLEVFTDQPALQFYSGNFFDGTTCGKYGYALKYRESLALETQKFPDSPHHGNFPSTRLNPGESYTHTCVYRFSTK